MPRSLLAQVVVSFPRPSSVALVAAASLLGVACEDAKKPSAAGATSATVAATTTAAASATAPPAASASVAPKRTMPPRPVPLGSSGPIQPAAPPEQQIMAIQYTIAMLSPDSMDPIVDKAWLDDMLKKLEGAVRTADKGKTPPNPVTATKGNRKIEIQMGKGCTDKVPANLIGARGGSSLKAAHEAGVLVVMCHDDKWECHQSTRDPDDVLCLAAPRSGR